MTKASVPCVNCLLFGGDNVVFRYPPITVSDRDVDITLEFRTESRQPAWTLVMGENEYQYSVRAAIIT